MNVPGCNLHQIDEDSLFFDKDSMNMKVCSKWYYWTMKLSASCLPRSITVLKNPTEPEVQRHLLRPCEMRFRHLHKFLIGTGLTRLDFQPSLQKRDMTPENHLACKHFIVSCAMFFSFVG